MKASMRTMSLALLCFIGIPTVYCRDIHVSMFNSSDAPTCGSLTLPCKSLSYAINEIAQDNDCIKLNGGNYKQPTLYRLNTTISLNKSISLTNWEQNNTRPIITRYSSLLNVAFNVKQLVSFQYIRISNINFVNISLIKVSSAVQINVKNCDVENAPVDILQVFVNKQTQIHINLTKCSFISLHGAMTVTNFNGSIDIKNCTFRSPNLAKHRNGLKIIGEIIKTLSDNSSIDNTNLRSNIFTLRLRECILTNLHSAIYMAESNPNRTSGMSLNLEIYNSTFISNHESIVTFPFYRIYVYNSNFIKNTGFNGSAFSVINTQRLSILHSRFIDNTGGAVVVKSETSSNVIDHCLFLCNSAKRNGGAIYISGNMKIENSIFDKNIATFLGGAIYHKCCTRNKCTSLRLNNVTIKSSRHISTDNGAHLSSSAKIEFDDVRISMAEPLDNNVELEGLLIHDVRLLHRFKFTCPRNFRAVVVEPNDNSTLVFLSISCRVCSRGLYSLDKGRVDSTDQSITSYAVSNVKCMPCPVGGYCDKGITSKDHFWGYVVNKSKSEIRFATCPSSYCCSRTEHECVSYNTCNVNRTGILCGKCIKTYSQNYFGHNCISNADCQIGWFWTLSLLYVLLYVLFLAYFTEISSFVHWVVTASSSTRHMDLHSLTGFKITVFFFYQMAFLLLISAKQKDDQSFLNWLKNIVSALFNFHVINHQLSTLCPVRNLTTMDKSLFKVMVPFSFFVMLMLCYFVSRLIRRLKRTKEDTFKTRAKVTFLEIMLITYTAITKFTFTMTHCESIHDTKRLYIYADQICYAWWQYPIFIFIGAWVIPFPVATYIGCNMLHKQRINLRQFITVLVLPPAMFYYYFRPTEFVFTEVEQDENDQILELFTGPFKGEEDGDSIWKNWEVVILIRRLILGVLLTVIANPVTRLFCSLPIFALSLMHHVYIMPFKDKLFNLVEMVSLFLLLLLNSMNLFWAFKYMNGISLTPGMKKTAILFVWIEELILFIPVFLIVLIPLYLLMKRIYNIISKWYLSKFKNNYEIVTYDDGIQIEDL